jgi:hypothetical protein
VLSLFILKGVQVGEILRGKVSEDKLRSPYLLPAYTEFSM